MIWQGDEDLNTSNQTREFRKNIPAEEDHSQHQSLLHYHFPVKIANTTEFPAEVTPASYWVCRVCLMCLIHLLYLAIMISSPWFLNELRQNTGTVMCLSNKIDSVLHLRSLIYEKWTFTVFKGSMKSVKWGFCRSDLQTEAMTFSWLKECQASCKRLNAWIKSWDVDFTERFGVTVMICSNLIMIACPL